MNILYSFIAIPLLMLITLLIVKERKQILTLMSIGSLALLTLAISLCVMYLQHRSAGGETLFLTQTWQWYPQWNISLSIGVDGIAVLMILLSAVIVCTGVYSSWKMAPLANDYFFWYTLLSLGVFGFFITTDLFCMFLFYEIALIPMFFLIGVWGSGPKEYAAMKLTLMLMGGSALLLISILGIYFFSGATSMNLHVLSQVTIPIEAQRLLFPLCFVGFGILGALFPFHTWSPDGHASAPTAVSMLHAGVLMKLGGYGCFRVALFLMPEAAQEQAWIFLILTGISVVYGAYSAIVQTDLKYINAYSSVSHCGLVLFALLMLNQTAMTGAIMQMLSHGLMTALFFALIGMIYGRTHTRSILEMGGLMRAMPFIGVAYVIAGLASLGLPGLSGFVAEMTIFVGSFSHPDPFHRVLTILACSAIVITAVYILRVVGRLILGPAQNTIPLEDAHWYERISAIPLIIAIIGIGLFPQWISLLIQDSLLPIIEQLSR